HMANGYGMTEVGITSVELSMDPKVLASGSIGEPMASVHYEVGANNELIISGRSIAKRVCIDGVEQPLDNGRLRTGDLVKNEKGRLYLLGRRDDTIIDENGENLNPTIVENLITDVEPGSVCLIGSRENDTVIPTLLVSVKPFIGDKQLEALKSGIRDKLSKNGLSGHIGHIVFITEPLMRESEFKLNRRLIASKYASGRFRRLETENPEGQRIRGEIESRVGACFAEILGIKAEDIDPIGDFFIALGGSSLDFYRLVAALEREFGVTLPNDPSGILCTVEGMSEYIESRLSE
ncbi:MAG: phosphopantetheine-binding protein, partial [Clostridia bacterium]|nr:phosphopantetheine-binding protein [Clostridia bacterium]